MKINQDKVPINLDEAVTILKDGMLPADILEFKKDTFSPHHLHFGLGVMLRNDWSLWDRDTRLVKWFKEKYGIDHADDISGLILDCLYRDIVGLPRREKELARQFLEHWKKQKKK